MKIIDLLNKIANGEKVPEYISYYNKKESMSMIMLPCKDNIIYRLNEDAIDLGDEVEILEEEKKIPERVPNAEVFEVPKLNNMELSNIALTNKEDIRIIKDTLNKVLDYLKSKGE